MPAPRDLLDLAANQHSVLGRDDFRAAGISAQGIRRLVTQGWLAPHGVNVFRVQGAAETPELRAASAVFDTGSGSLLSHRSALAWWGLPGFKLQPLEVLRPHGAGLPSRAVARVHVTRSLPPHHQTEHRGVAITTPARTLFDVAGSINPARLERTLETAWTRNLVSGPHLHRLLRELARRGRRGIPVMRELLAARPPDYVPCESSLELRLTKLLAEDGQAPLERQVDLGDDHWIGRVDFLDRAARVVVEVQSYTYHGSLLDRARDAERRRRLEAAGWTVIEVTEFHIWFSPGKILDRIRKARCSGAELRHSVT